MHIRFLTIIALVFFTFSLAPSALALTADGGTCTTESTASSECTSGTCGYVSSASTNLVCIACPQGGVQGSSCTTSAGGAGTCNYWAATGPGTCDAAVSTTPTTPPANSPAGPGNSNPPAGLGNPASGGTTLINPLQGGGNLQSFLVNILRFVVRIGSIIVVLMLVYVGFKFVAAQGEPGKISEARNMLLWTVIGGLVLLGAEVIAMGIQATVTALTTPGG